MRPSRCLHRIGTLRLRGRAAPIVALLACLLGAPPAAAQPEATRSTHAMRQKVFEKLSRAQTDADAGDFTAAFEALDHVVGMKDRTPYETAQLYTTMGYARFLQGRMEESIQAYKTVLQQPDLPQALTVSTLFTVAQLQFQQGNHADAIAHLERWFTLAENPGPEPYLLLAQAHAQQQEFQAAAEALDAALRIARERNQSIPESWLALQRSVYHELGDNARLREVLEILVARFPQRAYWLHLASVYGDLGLEERQLAAYEIAFEAGYLDRSDEVVLLAQLLLQAQVPYRAAQILESGMEQGTVERSVDTYRLLSQAWLLAREDRRSIEILQRASELSQDGEIDARLAQSHANLRQWEDAAQAARRALDKGVQDTSEVHLLLGTALFELGRLGDSLNAFQQAEHTPQTQERARQWIAYITREQERQRVETGG